MQTHFKLVTLISDGPNHRLFYALRLSDSQEVIIRITDSVASVC